MKTYTNPEYRKWIIWIASGGYCGFFPFAPGTIGSVAALPFAFLLSGLSTAAACIALILFSGMAMWVADQAESISGCSDPGFIVIDEIAGMLFTLLGLPFGLRIVLAGFILFRIMDVIKPFPIGYLESKIPGGAGVVIDDVVAGILCNGILWILVACHLF